MYMCILSYVPISQSDCPSFFFPFRCQSFVFFWAVNQAHFKLASIIFATVIRVKESRIWVFGYLTPY